MGKQASTLIGFGLDKVEALPYQAKRKEKEANTCNRVLDNIPQLLGEALAGKVGKFEATGSDRQHVCSIEQLDDVIDCQSSVQNAGSERGKVPICGRG